MRVVDTSAWIEWLTESSVGSIVALALPPTDEWVVPTIVQLELEKWLTREVSEETANDVIAFSATCIVADLDTAIALSAAELGAKHRLSTADSIVYATSLAHGADLLTCDSHFEQLTNVRFVPK